MELKASHWEGGKKKGREKSWFWGLRLDPCKQASIHGPRKRQLLSQFVWGAHLQHINRSQGEQELEPEPSAS